MAEPSRKRRCDPGDRVVRIRRWSLTASAAAPGFILAGFAWLVLRAQCLRTEIYNPICETSFLLPLLLAALVPLAVGWVLWHQFRIGREEESAQELAEPPVRRAEPPASHTTRRHRLRMEVTAVGRQWRRGDAPLPESHRVQRRIAFGSFLLTFGLVACFIAGTRIPMLYFHPAYVSLVALLLVAAWVVHGATCLLRLWRLRRARGSAGNRESGS